MRIPLPSNVSFLPTSTWLRTAAVCVALLTTAGVIAIFWPEIRRLDDLEERAYVLSNEAQALEAQLAELQRKHRWLRDDPAYLEAVARDRLNLQRPGETVFRFPSPDETPAP